MANRIFVYDGREFPDPDPNLKVDEVRQNMANFFPELSNAETKESKRGEDTIIEFKRRVGVKGCRIGYCSTKQTTYGGWGGAAIKKGRCPVCGGRLIRTVATDKKV